MFHIMRSNKWPKKSVFFIDSIIAAARKANIEFTCSDGYRKCKALVLYGLGGADRHNIAMDHIRSGGRLVCFDLGYWDRHLSVTYRKYRVSIDGFHPENIMLGHYPGSKRWDKAHINIETSTPSKNNILLIGNAPKSIAVGASGWTKKKSIEIRQAFPNHKIIYRPKPKRPDEPGVDYDSKSVGPIESQLAKVSLVVCRHSNVAVDACIKGVPVVCDDGAASCIYPSDPLRYNEQPSIEMRTEFLHRLAYWQWSSVEGKEFWRWITKQLEYKNEA